MVGNKNRRSFKTNGGHSLGTGVSENRNLKPNNMAQFEIRRSNLQALMEANPSANGFIVSASENGIDVVPNINEINSENQGGQIFGCPFPSGC